MSVNAQPVPISAETPTSITVRSHTPSGDAAWDAYAQAHPNYTLYHGRDFHTAVAEAFGKRSHGLVAEDETGCIVGILPLIRQQSRLFGDRLVSQPYANHGGPLADTPDIARTLYAAAVREAERLGGPQLEVRDRVERDIDWPARTDKVLMTLALPGSNAELDKVLGAKLRSQCRRALKEGAAVALGGTELVPEFYRVFAVNMRDLGTPVYPQRWFEVLAKHLREAMRLVVVRLDGRAVAGAVLMRWQDTLEIPWAASDRAYNRYAVNMLLYREALGHAIESGCAAFDFGRSTRGSGPHRFKQQWGAQESTLWWREKPAGGRTRRVSEWLRRGWMWLPVGITNRLGPLVSPEMPW
jgi:serine/alanine adding enzyme